MRRGQHPEIIIDQQGIVLGVNLSYDFTVEHEWGIKGLQNYFGIPDKISIHGLFRRKITVTPDTLRWISYTKDKAKIKGFLFKSFFCNETASEYATRTGELTSRASIHRKQSLASAWSENDFAIVSTDPKQINQLKEIFNAFATQDIVIMLGGRQLPFENAGLIIAIASRLPQETIDMWIKHDEAAEQLEKDVVASGIREFLKKHKCVYFVLTPHRQSDGSIKFWLNPYHQDIYNFGYFTDAELRLWAENRGPILKQESEKKSVEVEDDIDFSDIPEIKDWSDAVRGKFYRGTKK